MYNIKLCRQMKHTSLLDGHRFDLGSSTVAYMVNGVTNQYSTTERLDEVRR